MALVSFLFIIFIGFVLYHAFQTLRRANRSATLRLQSASADQLYTGETVQIELKFDIFINGDKIVTILEDGNGRRNKMTETPISEAIEIIEVFLPRSGRYMIEYHSASGKLIGKPLNLQVLSPELSVAAESGETSDVLPVSNSAVIKWHTGSAFSSAWRLVLTKNDTINVYRVSSLEFSAKPNPVAARASQRAKVHSVTVKSSHGKDIGWTPQLPGNYVIEYHSHQSGVQNPVSVRSLRVVGPELQFDDLMHRPIRYSRNSHPVYAPNSKISMSFHAHPNHSSSDYLTVTSTPSRLHTSAVRQQTWVPAGPGPHRLAVTVPAIPTLSASAEQATSEDERKFGFYVVYVVQGKAVGACQGPFLVAAPTFQHPPRPLHGTPDLRYREPVMIHFTTSSHLLGTEEVYLEHLQGGGSSWARVEGSELSVKQLLQEQEHALRHHTEVGAPLDDIITLRAAFQHPQSPPLPGTYRVAYSLRRGETVCAESDAFEAARPSATLSEDAQRGLNKDAMEADQLHELHDQQHTQPSSQGDELEADMPSRSELARGASMDIWRGGTWAAPVSVTLHLSSVTTPDDYVALVPSHWRAGDLFVSGLFTSGSHVRAQRIADVRATTGERAQGARTLVHTFTGIYTAAHPGMWKVCIVSKVGGKLPVMLFEGVHMIIDPPTISRALPCAGLSISPPSLLITVTASPWRCAKDRLVISRDCLPSQVTSAGLERGCGAPVNASAGPLAEGAGALVCTLGASDLPTATGQYCVCYELWPIPGSGCKGPLYVATSQYFVIRVSPSGVPVLDVGQDEKDGADCAGGIAVAPPAARMYPALTSESADRTETVVVTGERGTRRRNVVRL